MFCVGCGAPLGGGRFCRLCGADQLAPAVSTSPVGIDLRRLAVVDIVVGVASLVVLVAAFLPWYSVTTPGSTITTYYGALSGSAGGFRYLIVVLAIMLIGFVVAKTIWRVQPALPLPEWQLLTAVSGLEIVVVTAAFLAAPAGLSTGGPGAGIGLCGAVVAVVAAGQGRVARDDAEGGFKADLAPNVPRAPEPQPNPGTTPSSTSHQATTRSAGSKSGAASSTGSDLVASSPTSPGSGGPGAWEPEAAAPSAGNPTCAACHAEISVTNRFCTTCGTPVR